MSTNQGNNRNSVTIINISGQSRYPPPDRENRKTYVIVEEEPPYVEENNENNNNNNRRINSWGVPEFESKSRRMAFVRKVLGLVALEVFISALWTAACINWEPLYQGVRDFWWISIIAIIILFSILIAVSCCGVGMGPPNGLNVTLYILASFCLAFLTGLITANYDIGVILLALAVLVAIFVILILITAFTKLDITGWGMYLFAFGMLVLLFGFVAAILGGTGALSRGEYKILHLVYAFLAAGILTFYVLYDLQMIMGGQRKYTFSEDMWLFATLNLALDMFTLFIYLLQIIGLLRQ